MNIRLFTATGLLILSYVAALMVPRLTTDQTVRVTLIVLAVAVFGWFIVEEIRMLRACDELHQRIQLEALAVAFPLSILLIVTLGLLERVLVLPPGDWSFRHIWPVMIMFYFVGLAFARKRYR